jgi:O-antigen ligase
LAILARTGVVGLFFISAASFASVRLLIRLVRSSPRPETTLIASCLLSCFAAIATFASANVTLESPYHAMFFWLLIGMGIALAETEEGVDGLVSRS